MVTFMGIEMDCFGKFQVLLEGAMIDVPGAPPKCSKAVLQIFS